MRKLVVLLCFVFCISTVIGLDTEELDGLTVYSDDLSEVEIEVLEQYSDTPIFYDYEDDQLIHTGFQVNSTEESTEVELKVSDNWIGENGIGSLYLIRDNSEFETVSREDEFLRLEISETGRYYVGGSEKDSTVWYRFFYLAGFVLLFFVSVFSFSFLRKKVLLWRISRFVDRVKQSDRVGEEVLQVLMDANKRAVAGDYRKASRMLREAKRLLD